jgi:hypothetical protein
MALLGREGNPFRLWPFGLAFGLTVLAVLFAYTFSLLPRFGCGRLGRDFWDSFCFCFDCFSTILGWDMTY